MGNHGYGGERLELLKSVAERVFEPNFDLILGEWAQSYDDLDPERIFSPAEFQEVCRRILRSITGALAGGDIEAGSQEVARLSTELASARFPFMRIPEFIHRLEDAYNPILLSQFQTSPDLLQIVVNLDELMHKFLEVIAESYFNNVRESITEELATGRILEAAFRPRLAPHVKGLDIGVLYRSATETALIGGDFYDFFFMPDGRLAVALGDVSGKGVEAASTAAMTKYMLRAFAFESHTAGEVLGKLNKALENITASTEFVTAALMLYDVGAGKVTLAAAGHPPCVIRPAAGDPRFVELLGVPLGIIDDFDFPERELKLQPGDLILLYTDGLVEARDGGEFFGYERILELLAPAIEAGSQAVVDGLLEACQKFAGGRLKDDIALVAVRKT